MFLDYFYIFIASPEKEATLIDDLMEKESLIEKSDNLSDIEKAVIEVELEKKLTHELLESKEKDEFMSQATEDPNYPSSSTTEKSPEDEAIENLVTKLEATTENNLSSSTMSEIEKEKVNEIFNELQEENLDTKLEATTESINLGSSTEKNEVGALENQVQRRKKRDIQSIGKTMGETIVEEAMEISEATLDDPNASSRETERAEQLFVYTKDFIENLEAIDKSDISDREKIEIEDKLEGDAIDEAAEAVQDLAEFNKPPNSKEAIEKQVKENLETFLEDVDIQR